jgi:hypothetical protein
MELQNFLVVPVVFSLAKLGVPLFFEPTVVFRVWPSLGKPQLLVSLVSLLFRNWSSSCFWGAVRDWRWLILNDLFRSGRSYGMQATASISIRMLFNGGMA